ncbi:MAG: pilus assembly protein [Chloroflexi bacterium]|nr:pilus assembly protein [Chloroflexota bacterium]
MKRIPFKRSEKNRAQAMVEFMLALPLLVVLLYGIIEVSRLVFIFASVANASRQAARYGAAAGETNDIYYYQDCEGIRKVAKKSAIISSFDEINITYDRGLTPEGEQIQIPDIDPSPDTTACPIKDNTIRNGDRIIVQVSSVYEPIIPILPIEPFTVVSASARTFLISVPIVGSSMPMEFSAETATPSPEPTFTPSGFETPTEVTIATPTTGIPGGGRNTPPSVFLTNTQLALTNQPGRNTPIPPTLTFTPTITPPPTSTSSITPTAISCTGFSGIFHGPLHIKDNIMEMSINNSTGYTLSTAQVYVEWNHDTGHPSGSDRSLRLQQILIASHSWSGDIHAPSAYIPAFYPSIPPGLSTIQFVFHQKYDLADGTERIIVTLGTPGCVNYPIDSRN